MSGKIFQHQINRNISFQSLEYLSWQASKNISNVKKYLCAIFKNIEYYNVYICEYYICNILIFYNTMSHTHTYIFYTFFNLEVLCYFLVFLSFGYKYLFSYAFTYIFYSVLHNIFNTFFWNSKRKKNFLNNFNTQMCKCELL